MTDLVSHVGHLPVNGIIPLGPAQGVCSPMYVTQPMHTPEKFFGEIPSFQHRCQLSWSVQHLGECLIRSAVGVPDNPCVHFAPTWEVLVVLVWVVVVTGIAAGHFGPTWEALESRRSPSVHSILSRNSPSGFNFDCSIN